MALFSSGFKVTLSKSLFHLNFSTFSVEELVLPSFAFVQACLSVSLIDALRPCSYSCAVESEQEHNMAGLSYC